MTDHNFANDPRRFDRDLLIQALNAIQFGELNRNNQRCCPFHAENTPSLHIHQSKSDRVYRYKCFGCDASGDIYDAEAHAAGMNRSDYLKDYLRDRATRPAQPSSRPRENAPAPQPEKPKEIFPTIDALRARLRNVVDVHAYTNPDTGKADYLTFRIEEDGKKRFIMAGPVDGGYTFGAPEKPWPLYNRKRLRDHKTQTILFVEGEKCVHVATDYGLLATTTPGGSKNGDSADLSELAGRKICIWPDHDQPGADYADTIIRRLQELRPAPTITRINPAHLNLQAGEDIADYVAGYGKETAKYLITAALQDEMDRAKLLGPAGDLIDRYQLIFAGKWRAEPLPFPQLHRLTRAALPGSMAVICGDPGSKKSFFLQQCALHWHTTGIKTAYFHLEKDRVYHLNRAHAQIERQANYFNDEWLAQNQRAVEESLERCADLLNTFGNNIWECPLQAPHIMNLAEWVEARCAEGYRILCIDPITAAGRGREPWNDDLHFVMRANKALRDAGASLFVITHPKKGTKTGAALDDLAGGAAFTRNTDTVLFMISHPWQWRDIITHGMGGTVTTQSIECNVAIRLIKTRNSAGFGLETAYRFVGNELTFYEAGLPAPKTKKTDKPITNNTTTSTPQEQEDVEEEFAF